MENKPEKPICGLCGEPMPPGEEMFQYHGHSGPCPKPAKEVSKAEVSDHAQHARELEREAQNLAMMCFRLMRKNPDEKLKAQVNDYLRRIGRQGSILRSAQ